MKTIQKPKRMWQKKKDYNKKKLIRKIQRRNKTSFDGGKDESYSDLKTNRPIIIGPGLLSMFTPKPKGYKEGKNCFDIGTDNGQQIIYQDGDQYFAGPSESAATIKVTPYIQRLPNDKSTWDFVDDSGKLYTTKYSDEQLKYLYGQNTPGSEFYTWTDRSGKQHRQMKIIPVSPVDPVGEMAVETAIGYPLFKGVGWAGKQLVNDFVKDFAFTKLGNWTKNKILSSALNKNVKAWDGTVGPEYFHSPYNWYRWTETPEIQSLRRYGKNITTEDSYNLLTGGTPDAWRRDAMKNRIWSRDGYWYKKLDQPEKTIALKRKPGSSHGNRSQAAYGTLWDGGTSTSGIGHLGVLEGGTGVEIPTGTVRSFYTTKPVDKLRIGQRVGFQTGEMPMDNLSWFEQLPNGRFSYKGLVLPDKRLQYYPTLKDRVSAFVDKFKQDPKFYDEAFDPTINDYQNIQIYNALVKAGVDPKKLTKNTIQDIVNFSHNTLKENMPRNANIISDVGDLVRITDYQNKKAVGGMTIDRHLSDGLYHINMVNRYGDIGNKIYEHTLQGAVNHALKKGSKGVVSGERLLMPDVTKHIWEKPYIKSIHIGNTGVHGQMPNIKTGQEVREILDMPYIYPTRSVEFDPNYAIDDYGNFWRSWEGSDIFHNSGKDIHIKKANRGKFTEAANEHNMGVQEFARQVLSAPKGKYSSTLRKRANFARNFAH